MVCSYGMRSWRCRGCGTTLQLPWDYCRPLRRQPTKLVRLHNRIILDHARRAPHLHPLLMPYVTPGRRR